MPPIRDLLVLGLIIASLPVCFFRPFYGVALWSFLAFLNPHRMTWGAARDFPVALLVAVATVGGFLLFRPQFQNLWRREVLLILLLWVWFAITSLVTTHMPVFESHAADTWERFSFVSKILLMTLVSVGVVGSWDRLRRFVLCIAASFGILLIRMLPWMLITRGAFKAYGPEGTMIGDNNDFGLALNMTFPIFFFLAKSESNPKLRKLLWFLTAITVPAVFFTWSRGALVGLIAVTAFIFWSSKQKLLLIPILLLGTVLGVFFTSGTWQNRMTGIVENPVDASVEGRLNAWHFAWNLASDYPLTGGGFGAFEPGLFARYAPNAVDLHASHSIYFGMLAEHGFVGLGLYLTLLASCFLSLRRLKRVARFTGDDRLTAYSNMLQGSLVAFMVSGAFLGRHYFDYFFDLVACIAMLKTAVEKEFDDRAANEEASEEPLAGELTELSTQ